MLVRRDTGTDCPDAFFCWFYLCCGVQVGRMTGFGCRLVSFSVQASPSLQKASAHHDVPCIPAHTVYGLCVHPHLLNVIRILIDE